MTLAAGGMLAIFTDGPGDDEADFHRWYDREHIAERVRIPGFRAGIRYEAYEGGPRWLALYPTDSFATLDSADYHARLARPSPWSERVMAKLGDAKRQVARVSLSFGQGLGGTLAVVRLPAPHNGDGRRAALRADLATAIENDGVLAAHLLESDADLSRSIGGAGEGTAEEADDWLVLLEATRPVALEPALMELLDSPEMSGRHSVACYRLMSCLTREALRG